MGKPFRFLPDRDVRAIIQRKLPIKEAHRRRDVVETADAILEKNGFDENGKPKRGKR